MAKVKVHIDSPDPSPEKVKSYKGYHKVEGKLDRFYTLKGMRRVMRENKYLFIALMLLWVLYLLYILGEF